MAIQANDQRITLVAGGYPLFANGKIAGAIGVGGGTEEQDCQYAEEEVLLKTLFNRTARISHIGSTAIRSIWAKPIIDILVEVPRGCNLSNIRDLLVDNGYICMSRSNDRISFKLQSIMG